MRLLDDPNFSSGVNLGCTNDGVLGVSCDYEGSWTQNLGASGLNAIAVTTFPCSDCNFKFWKDVSGTVRDLRESFTP
jgi:hypothetical protein